MDKRAFENSIDELKRRNDIVDVVSAYAAVQQKGKRYWARCPIHNEKTPSMLVDREDQTFHCFGCGRGGDVIKFIQEVENLDFKEAVNMLAERVGMESPFSGDSFVSPKEKNVKEVCYAVCLAAAKYYHECLLGPEGSEARRYLTGRGIEKSAWTAFGLGVSPDFGGLPKRLAEKGFSLEDAAKAGVVNVNSRKEYYDVLYQRLIVPILNANGHVVAFGGRILEKNADRSKYKNTSETPVFEKGKNLFGINLVKKLKTTQRIENIIVVEGYMDVIALYQAGFTNAVAGMGTALTKEQARLLRRFAGEVYICYDGDTAGQAATVRGLDILREEELDVFVMSLPDGMDPDDFVRVKGAEEFRRQIDKALPLVDYKLNLLQKKFDINHPEGPKREEFRRKYVESALPILRNLKEVERESYLNSVSLKTGYSKEFLTKAVSEEKTAVLPPQQKRRNKMAAHLRALCFVAKAALAGWEWDGKKPYCYGNAALEEIFDYVIRCRGQNKPPVPSMVYQLAEGDEDIIEGVLSRDLTVPAAREYFSDCLAYLKKQEIKARLAEVSDQYNQTPDPAAKTGLLAEITRLTAQINTIKEVNMTEDKDGNN